MPTLLAIAAHPDDIEFCMAGTMLAMARRGWDLHYFNLCRGNLGSATIPGPELAEIRAGEAQAAAAVLGATWHPPIAPDLELFYTSEMIRRVAAVVRIARPSVILTHSPEDYMEDHMIASRLAVTAAFARGMPNLETVPPVPSGEFPVRIYHALPHGLHDAMGRGVEADSFVDTTLFHARKREALARHASQKEWLDQSQGMDSYLVAMDDFSREVARMAAPGIECAEGWRRHSHLGFCPASFDPLADVFLTS
ncbi:MAG: PIG-L family deacetylase [Verrucomicrobiota bacterium]|jgi:LmbE family N-acetylglucosaminyl deacetylase